MNFKELAQYPVTVTCPVGGGFEMTVDANKYNGECYRRMARTYRQRAGEFEQGAARQDDPAEETLQAAVERYEQTMELTAITADLEREQYADALACDRHGILIDWEQDEDGRHVLPTFENLMQVPGPTLKAIFETGREAANPKKQATQSLTVSNPTTLETSNDGSSDLDTLSSTSPLG